MKNNKLFNMGKQFCYGTIVLLVMGITVYGQGQTTNSGDAVQQVVQKVGETNPIKQPAVDLYPEIVAEVNGEKITRDQLMQESLRIHGETTLNRMLHRALILAECKRQNIIITRDDVEKEITRMAKQLNLDKVQLLDTILKENNMTGDQFANDVIWPRLALEALIVDKIQVSADEIERKYLSKYGPSIGLLMIMTDSKEKADNIRKKVVADPDSFGEIAKTESIDIATASNKGRMQPVFQYSLPDKELEQKIFSLEKNDISEVIGPYGPQNSYLIFKCENRYNPIVPRDKIDKIKDQLKNQAKAEKLKSASEALYIELKKAAKVENVLANPQLRAQYPNIAAMVNGQPIYLASVMEMCLSLYAKTDLEAMLSLRLIQQECKKVQLNITNADIDTEIFVRAAEVTLPLPDGSPNIKEYLESELSKHEVTNEIYRSNIVWPAVALKKLSGGLVKVTDEDIQKGFEANFGPRVQCLAIVVHEERRARDVWQKARTLPAKDNRSLEEVFGELAAEYSIEPGSKQMKGRIPPIIKNGGQPKLEEEAFKLKKGELSSVIQVEQGTYVILYCQDLIAAREVTLDQVKDSIVSDLKKKKGMLAVNQYYTDMIKRANIMNYITNERITPEAKTMAVPSTTPEKPKE